MVSANSRQRRQNATVSGQAQVELNASGTSTPRRSTRAAAQKTQTTSPYVLDTDEDEPSDNDDDAFSVVSTDSSLPDVRDITRLAPSARSSISSADQSYGNTEGTEYSTPVTSGVSTPSMAMSGKASAAPGTRAQRQRLFGTKRKRYNPEDDEDDELDNSRDALLAHQLQLEDAQRRMSLPAKASTWNQPGLESRPSRKSRLRNTIKKSDVVEENPINSKHSHIPSSKRLKVELKAGSNIVRFGNGHSNATIISDSLDEDEDDDMTAKPPSSSARKAKYKSKAMQTSVLKGTPLQRKSINDRKSKYEVSESSGSDSDSLPSLSSGSDVDESYDLSDMPAIADLVQDPDFFGLVQPNYDLGLRQKRERFRLETHHPELHTMWQDLENMPRIDQSVMIDQPDNINRELKPFQRAGVAWMQAMEKTSWGGGLLGDEMGMGKTIQAVSLIMSDFPASKPTLVLIPPVALMQWQQEIADYTDGTLTTFVYHGTNAKTKTTSLKDLKKYNVILMSYNSLESMYRKQEKGFQRKAGLHKEKSLIHQIDFHRVILDEAHNIKSRTSGSAKACFALTADHKWCLSGTPLQNRIGELFSLIRFLDIQPFACYFCKQCPCSKMEWQMDETNRCTECQHSGMQHVSVFNQELLNPIQKFGNNGPGKEAFRKLRILTGRFMLRRVKRDHSAAMELPHKEIFVDRHFFGEEENDFAGSIMNNGTRKFETYVAQGVLLNNYANIFGLIMQMRQVADHPDLILKKNNEGGQNVLVCCVCDETAEDAIRSVCRHDFCRECAKHYMKSAESPDCPRCHIGLAIDLEAPTIEQDETQVKKSSIINRIKMEDWVSSTKIEALVQNLYQLRYNKMSTKSIIFSQFTSMLDLIGWRLHRAGITTVALDGSMTPAQRQASINHFMTDSSVECFLVSLKAGGVALNLTEASHVFIVDPWWNPAAEWQSADRCHRIGQARPCSITRLCIEDSVESRMVLLQEKKANMINSTINSDDSAMESLTPEDMQFLFRGN